MTHQITFTVDAAEALRKAGAFLALDPVRNNLVLTLLHGRVSRPETGRYWTAHRGSEPLGFVFQSPLHYRVQLSTMSPETAVALADGIADSGVALPGCAGEAAAAAAFAGQWTERTKSAATPLQGLRVYEATHCQRLPANGILRRAVTADRELLIDWMRGFMAETGEDGGDPATGIDRRLQSETYGRYWLWEDGGPVSMSGDTVPVEGVVRIGSVYTPPECRGRGYASALVSALTRQHLDAGRQCILFTQLQNSTSNSIYRRMGYRAIAEGIAYRFA